MKFLIAGVLLALLAVQEAPEPPAGWFCRPAGRGVPADHACACKRMTTTDTSCEDVHEDPVCRVFCHADHCRCPVVCEKPS